MVILHDAGIDQGGVGAAEGPSQQLTVLRGAAGFSMWILLDAFFFWCPAGKVLSREDHWLRFLLPAGVKFRVGCGPSWGARSAQVRSSPGRVYQGGMCDRVKKTTGPPHCTDSRECAPRGTVQGAGVCSSPRRMGPCSSPSCWTPRASWRPMGVCSSRAPGWECA